MPSRRELANAIRVLSMDAVQLAKSGHPGAPMGMADIAEVLWNDFLRHNPANPRWFDRDRFVLSNGHGSMLLYSLLHLAGYDLGLDDLRQFRQLHSRTAGHPEYGLTPGVETTTGPLGQGLANAVGMALAERLLATRYNRAGHQIVNHHTYVFVGDGCLMEGISHEACSLAGTLRLGKLIAVYDDNGISIDGPVAGWFGDDTPGRFAAYGWHVVPAVDGHDPVSVRRAIEEARAVADRPSIICCKTVIGYGAPNLAGSHETHGAPLGEGEIAATREHIGWEHPAFELPTDIVTAWDAREAGASLEADWNQRLAEYRSAHPELAAELDRRAAGRLPGNFVDTVKHTLADAQERCAALATRKASQNALNAYAPLLPELVGGSADLTPSNNTTWEGTLPLNTAEPEQSANYLHYGVREFGMSAIMNGLALHGGFIPYGGTFLVFSDYARNAVRMAALMGAGTIFVYTHDSIGLGEDGPTHQPIEHIASLRLIPGMHVWRPCDEVESLAAWSAAIERRDGPTCLLFSRQGLSGQARSAEQVSAISRGGYVLRDCGSDPEALVMATGSEVQLAIQAAERLSGEGRRVRVVSVPCLEVFESQDRAYRESVLPPQIVARVIVEATVTLPWQGYAGPAGRVIGIDRFGESAPGGLLMETFGFTVERVVEALREVIRT